MTQKKHWNMEVDAQQIMWLGLDRQQSSVNTINDEVLDELNDILHDLSNNNQVKGLIIYSAKAKGFIAGADINVFSQLSDKTRVSNFLSKGQAVFMRLEKLQIPTVAMIDGFCMGGGMELALACDYRIATDDPSTRLGLPEVLLGIHPGWGGTVRLPQLIGGFQALTEVMLRGNSLRASKAKKIGMIDDVVPLRQLKRAAVYYIQNQPKKHRPTMLQSMTQYGWARRLIANKLRQEVAKQLCKEHYPAPYAMTSAQLIRVFWLRERIKAFAKNLTYKAQHVHVIGAGIMGGDIAAWCALRGLQVTIYDTSAEVIAGAVARAHDLFKKQLRTPRLIQIAMDKFVPDLTNHGVARADVIIEAVSEKLELKQSIFKYIEENAKPDAIIATNTSSLLLDDINQTMKNPERLVGIHFFNPVARMDLVEVVRGEKTLEEVEQRSCAFVGQIGKLPLPVKSSPGFLINRVLMPYLTAAVDLLEAGYAAEEIDAAATSFGMMMGPIELVDKVGMDVCLAVAQNLTSKFGGNVPQFFSKMVADGKLGRKSGEGFYQYKQGKPIKKKMPASKDQELLIKRLIDPMVKESLQCLEECVVEDADLLDGGMIFATGFAPFRGGPLHSHHQSFRAHATKKSPKLVAQKEIV
jgi:3-hydroxyacyl-CoA dehydrogenase / enoyl-CoA hydratase / 3-hydroxybutyryl-CoA epimerase